MLPNNRIPTHPGEILIEKSLIPMDLSQVKLAAHIGVPVQRINEIVRGKRGITPETEKVPEKVPGTLLRYCSPFRCRIDRSAATGPA